LGKNVANRSYLYSSNDLPESAEWQSKRVLHGISEQNYAIPLAFKILLSGNPTAVRSSIWETPEKIALSGDYQTGLHNLETVLSRIQDPNAASLIEESLQFLRDPRNVRQHFLLECGEIFDLTEGSIEEKNLALLSEIEEIGTSLQSIELPAALALADPPARRGFFSRIFGSSTPEKAKKPIDPLMPYYTLGLGNWSNILYFDFSQNET
jgi:hypothetical protein